MLPAVVLTEPLQNVPARKSLVIISQFWEYTCFPSCFSSTSTPYSLVTTGLGIPILALLSSITAPKSNYLRVHSSPKAITLFASSFNRYQSFLRLLLPYPVPLSSSFVVMAV